MACSKSIPETGSIAPLSIVRGQPEVLRRRDEPILLHRIIEHTIKSTENNNYEKIPTIHGITPMESEPGVLCGGKRLPLYIVNERANQLARGIQNNYVPFENVDKDVVICVEMKPSIELVITLMAILKTGAAYLPLDAAYPDDRVHYILNESKPTLVVADRVVGERYIGCTSTTFEDLWGRSRDQSVYNLAPESSWLKNTNEENRVCAIIYTSGSTGVAKGVRLPHRCAVQRFKWQWKNYPFSPTEEYVVFKTSLTFVDSISELWSAVLCGRSVLILQKSEVIDVQSFVATLDQFKVERLILVPSLLRSLLYYISLASDKKMPFKVTEKVKRNKLEHLKIVVCSGETLLVQLAQKFYQFFPEKETVLLNLYGSTETMGDILFYPVPNGEKLSQCKTIPIGYPMDNTNIYLLDKHMEPVRKGQVGEMYASGAHIALGYVNDSEPGRFVDNPFSNDPVHCKLYKTGDYARWEQDVIDHEGRMDSQIKIRGHKVDISEVSSAVSRISFVEKHVVLCYKAGHIDQALVAFVVPKRKEVTAAEVEGQLEAKLPPYMIPSVFMVDAIPLLVNGKVDRQTLLNKYAATAKTNSVKFSSFDFTGIPEPDLGKAKALYEAVATTLGSCLRKKIEATSNYYSLGGNSLNSLNAVTTLKDLGYSISIGDFVTSVSMLEIIAKMEDDEYTGQVSPKIEFSIDEAKYKIEILQDHHMEDVLRIAPESFYEKGQLKQWVPGITLENYRDVLVDAWNTLMEQQISFVVKDLTGECIGCSLNMDAHAEAKIHIHNKNLAGIYAFSDYLEAPFRTHVLPKGTGQIFHSFMMTTAGKISTQQNVELMLLMEQENINLARKKGYAGILATNTSPLTQQLGTDVFKYKVLKDYQVNKYVTEDGTAPFAKAPDSQRAVVSWLRLDEP